MSYKTLTDEDHVVRYCSPQTLDADGNPTGASFKLRPRDNNCLSVNWVEYFEEPEVITCMAKIRKSFYLQEFEIKRDGKFAILNIAKTKSIGICNNLDLQIKHMPEPNNESHAGICGYQEKNLEVAEDIAVSIDQNDLYPGIDTQMSSRSN